MLMSGDKPEVPMGFVRGGTSTTAWDNEMKKRSLDAEARRQHQDQERRHARTDPGANQHQMDLGSSNTHAVIVLAMRGKRSNFLEYQTCELSMEGGTRTAPGQEAPGAPPAQVEEQGLVLQLVCPRCVLERGREMQWSQLTLRSTQKQLSFRAGVQPKWMQSPHANLWVSPEDGTVYMVAGTVDVTEWCSCDHEGCGFRFKIDDSMLVS